MPKFLNHFRFGTLLPLGGAIAFAGIAGYIWYKLFQKDEEEEIKSSEVIPVIKLTSCELRIPRNSVGAVIGRQGSNIRMIEGKTSTSIKFTDDDDNNNNKICIIRGKIEKVEKAKEMVLQIVKNVPVTEEDKFIIPSVSSGAVLGRNGKVLEQIQRISGAKLMVLWDPSLNNHSQNGKSYDQDQNVIWMKGTTEQIKMAKDIIQEKVEEDRKEREMIKESVNKLSQRSKYYQVQTESSKEMEVEEELTELIDFSTLSNNISTLSTYEAFVSSIETAGHFWVQMIGPKMIKLDSLVVEMSAYYTDPSNRENVNIFSLQPGDMIAAQFGDKLWYRARVVNYNSIKKKLEVYFVDFGDTDFVGVEDVTVLRTDFLKLGFQAIECYLADVDLESCCSNEAIDAFEELSYCAQWKPVTINVVGYKQEGETTYPFVRILDTSGHQELDIAEELVRKNLVKWSLGKITCMTTTTASEEPSTM